MYRAVGNRLTVDFDALKLPVSNEKAIAILESIGFNSMGVDIITDARSLVDNAKYKRGARLREAPAVFDCSGLIKWLYGLLGIWLPRRSIQQREIGEIVDFPNRRPGDIIFCSGCIDYYWQNPDDGVGHVGIISDRDSVIHAANRKSGVIESSIDRFVENDKFRGIRRIVPIQGIHTIEFPLEREVEISDDIRWIVLQKLS